MCCAGRSGRIRRSNFFYRVLETVASPFTRVCRWIAPRFIADRHLPLVALSLLLIGYVWTMFAIASACMGPGCQSGNACSGLMTAERHQAMVFRSGGRVVRAVRQRERALEYYATMLDLDPNDALALASIAYQNAQLGRKRDALAMFERVLQVKPDDAEAHFNRGFLLQERKDPEGALAAFGRRWPSTRTIGRSTDSRCRSFRRGASRKRGPAQERTRSCSPSVRTAGISSARVQHELGRTDETQKVLDQLAKFEPKVHDSSSGRPGSRRAGRHDGRRDAGDQSKRGTGPRRTIAGGRSCRIYSQNRPHPSDGAGERQRCVQAGSQQISGCPWPFFQEGLRCN